MTPTAPREIDLASMAAAIERAEGDLALAEEPARFLAALEAGAPADAPGPGPGAPSEAAAS